MVHRIVAIVCTVVVAITVIAASTTSHVLDNLQHHVYCRLDVTDHGVGVRAIRHIPHGVDPFVTATNQRHRFVWIPQYDILRLDPAVRQLAQDMYAPTGPHGAMAVSRTGPNVVSLALLMNHSHTPNMALASRPHEPDEYATFVAARDIHAGEELTFDYRVLLPVRRS